MLHAFRLVSVNTVRYNISILISHSKQNKGEREYLPLFAAITYFHINRETLRRCGSARILLFCYPEKAKGENQKGRNVMKRRFFILAIFMMIVLMPAAVFADSEEGKEEATPTPAVEEAAEETGNEVQTPPQAEEEIVTPEPEATEPVPEEVSETPEEVAEEPVPAPAPEKVAENPKSDQTQLDVPSEESFDSLETVTDKYPGLRERLKKSGMVSLKDLNIPEEYLEEVEAAAAEFHDMMWFATEGGIITEGCLGKEAFMDDEEEADDKDRKTGENNTEENVDVVSPAVTETDMREETITSTPEEVTEEEIVTISESSDRQRAFEEGTTEEGSFVGLLTWLTAGIAALLRLLQSLI